MLSASKGSASGSAPESIDGNLSFQSEYTSVCSYWKFSSDAPCFSHARYSLEFTSREGPCCQACICRKHIQKAWEFGQRMLEQCFPERNLKLASISLIPIPEARRSRKAKSTATK
jgi:hypothetical protein